VEHLESGVENPVPTFALPTHRLVVGATFSHCKNNSRHS